MMILSLLASCAACSSVPADATWVSKDATRTDFHDPTNWSPPVVPTGIATVPPADPPRPLEPLVTINKPVTLLELRQNGGAVSGHGEIAFKGAGWSECGKDSNTGFEGTVRGNVRLCASPSPNFGYAQAGVLDGDVTVLGGAFGALMTFSPSSAGLTVTRSIVVDETGGLGVPFAKTGFPILSIQGPLMIRGGSTILWLFIEDEDVPSQTVVPIRANGGITGCFGKVNVTSTNYQAKHRCRGTDVEVELTRISSRARGRDAATTDYSWMPWAKRRSLQ
jgi:hypothetical protein